MKKRKKTQQQQTTINPSITPNEKKGVMNYLKKILTTGRLSVILTLISVIVSIVLYYANKTPEIEIVRHETETITDEILKTIPEELTLKTERDECLMVKSALAFIRTGTKGYREMQENAVYDKMNVEDDLTSALYQDLENRKNIIRTTCLAINSATYLNKKYIANYYGYGQFNLNVANSVKNTISNCDYDNRINEIESLLKAGKQKEAFMKLREFHSRLDVQEMYNQLFIYMKKLTEILTPRYQELLRQQQESVQ